MRTRARVAGAAVVFAVVMGAITSGGWWWAWLGVAAALILTGRVRLIGARLDLATRFMLRENRRTRRHNRAIARQRRRRLRDQKRAMRARRRQTQ